MNTLLKYAKKIFNSKQIRVAVCCSLSAAFSLSAVAQSWHEIPPVGYGATPLVAKVNNNKIYVGQLNNIGLHPRTFVSSDGGKSWQQYKDDSLSEVCNFAFDNKNGEQAIYFSKAGAHAGTVTQLYKIKQDFTQLTPLFHNDENFGETYCSQIIVSDSNLIVVDGKNFYYSNDFGRTFNKPRLPYYEGMDNLSVTNLVRNSEGTIIAPTSNQGILYSTDNGETWGLSNAPNQYNYTNQGTVVAGKSFYSLVETTPTDSDAQKSYSVFHSFDGFNWQETPLDFNIDIELYNFAVDDFNHMYVANDQGIWINDASTGKWRQILKEKANQRFLNIYNENLLNVERDGIVNIYSPKTNKWTQLTGLPNTVRSPMLSTSNAAYMETFDGLYKLTATDSQWRKVSKRIGSEDDGPNALFYSESDDVLYLGQQRFCNIYKSGDGGKTFTQVLKSLQNICWDNYYSGSPSISALANYNGKYMIGAFDTSGNVLESGLLTAHDDNDLAFVQGIKQWPYQFLQIKDGTIFAADGQDGVIMSKDNGKSWSYLNYYLPHLPNIKHLAYDPQSNLLFAAGYNVYQMDLSAAPDKREWKNISDGLSQSTDQSVNALLIHSGQLYITVLTQPYLDYYSGIYTKPIANADDSWTQLNDGITPDHVGELMYFNKKLYVNNDQDIYEYELP